MANKRNSSRASSQLSGYTDNHVIDDFNSQSDISMEHELRVKKVDDYTNVNINNIIDDKSSDIEERK